MGRIKTTQIKRTALELLEKHKNIFAKEFGENKQLVDKFTDVPSKKLRNAIAGYLTRIVKRAEEKAIPTH